MSATCYVRAPNDYSRCTLPTIVAATTPSTAAPKTDATDADTADDANHFVVHDDDDPTRRNDVACARDGYRAMAIGDSKIRRTDAATTISDNNNTRALCVDNNNTVNAVHRDTTLKDTKDNDNR